MGNQANLIPINPERARWMGKKGGAVKSVNKKIAARLRELKKKGLSDDNAKQLYQIMTDSDMSALDILTWIKGVKNKTSNPYQEINLIRAYNEWHKMHYGEKLKTENININIDMSSSVLAAYENRVKEVKEEKEE